uniref:non-specific serine/threonine protein kinase n=1 Tax=Hirondellea gigas TaxID=1518452 RepID=A0A2P2HXH6_9CRUS
MSHWKCISTYRLVRVILYMVCLLIITVGVIECVSRDGPSSENRNIGETTDIVEDFDTDEDYAELETVESTDYDAVDNEGDFTVPESGTKFSQLPDCSDDHRKSTSSSSNGALLLISTLDGHVVGLDFATGTTRWTHGLGHKGLLASSISQLVMQTADGESVRVVPALDGSLYQLQRNKYEVLPVSADTLLASSYKYSDNTFFSGSKVSEVRGIASGSGTEVYRCDELGCHQKRDPLAALRNDVDSSSKPLTDSDDVLLIRKTVRTIYAFNPVDGSERFNFSVGQHEVELVRSGGCKASSSSGGALELKDLPTPRFVLHQGLVSAVEEDTTVRWSKKLPSAIVGAWSLVDGQLSKVDLLQVDVVPSLVPLQASTSPHSPEMAGPEMYVGIHKGQAYIINSERMKSRAQAYLSALQHNNNRVQDGTVFAPPSINWKPYLASTTGLVVTAQEHQNVLSIEYKSDIPGQTSVATVDSSDVVTVKPKLHMDWVQERDGELREDEDDEKLLELSTSQDTGYYLFHNEAVTSAMPGHELPSSLNSGTNGTKRRRKIGPENVPWEPRYVMEENLDTHNDMRSDNPRHTRTWVQRLGFTLRIEHVVLLMCVMIGLRLLARPWYNYIMWVICFPLAYCFRNTLLKLLVNDREVQESVAMANRQGQERFAGERRPQLEPVDTDMPIPSAPILHLRSNQENNAPTSSPDLYQTLHPRLVSSPSNPVLPSEHTTIKTISEVANSVLNNADHKINHNNFEKLRKYFTYDNNQPAKVSITKTVLKFDIGLNQKESLRNIDANVQPNAVSDCKQLQLLNSLQSDDAIPTSEESVPALGSSPPLGGMNNVQAVVPIVPGTPATESDTPPTLQAQQSISDSGCSSLGTPCDTGTPRSRISEYEIHDILGWGGFGIVFKAYAALDESEYAIKRIPLPSKLVNQERVLREVRVLAKLTHVNIVRYYSCWQETHSLDWVTEYDKPWRKRANEKNFPESFVSPMADTTSPTDPYTNECKGADIIEISNKYNGVVLVDNNMDESRIQSSEDDELIVGKEYNSLYINSSTAKENLRNTQADDSFSVEFRNDTYSSNKSSEDECDIFSNKKDYDDSSSDDFIQFVDNSNDVCSQTNTNRSTSGNSDNTSSKDEDDSDIVFKNSSSGDKSDFIMFKDSSADGNENNSSGRSSKKNNEEGRRRSSVREGGGRGGGNASPRPSSLAVRSSLSDDNHNDRHNKQLEKSTNANKEFLYIQMELCDPSSLKDWLALNNERPMDKVLKYFLDIVRAMEHVHDKQMMHRDLKPSNIFFDRNQENFVKVGDFGLGTRILDDEDTVTARTPCTTQSGKTFENQHTKKAGTQSYMSPEQFDNRDYDYKVDIFSMGLILFEMLWVMTTGQEKIKVMKQLREQCFPEGFKQEHPEEYELLQLMLNPDPDKRPTTRGIRARMPLKKMQLPHELENIKESEHFTLAKKHRRNPSSESSIDLKPLS